MEILPNEIQHHIISYLSIKEIYKYHIHINDDVNVFTQYIIFLLKGFHGLCNSIHRIHWKRFDHSRINYNKGFTPYIFSLFDCKTSCKILYTIQNNKFYLLIKENNNKVIWIEPRGSGYYIQNFYKSLYEKDICYCENETVDIVREKIENIMCV